MRVIIAGCRHIEASCSRIQEIVDASGFKVTELVCGMANGVDNSGLIWARHYADIPVIEFPADWHKYGKAAGPIRNTHMAEYADALIVVWDGKSRGTLNMIECVRKLSKPYFVCPVGRVTLTDKFLNITWKSVR